MTAQPEPRADGANAGATLRVIDRDGGEAEVALDEDRSLMECLVDAGLPVAAVCGGECACGTCHVYVENGDATALQGGRNEYEAALLASLEHYDAARSRLSCQLTADRSLLPIHARLAPEE